MNTPNDKKPINPTAISNDGDDKKQNAAPIDPNQALAQALMEAANKQNSKIFEPNTLLNALNNHSEKKSISRLLQAFTKLVAFLELLITHFKDVPAHYKSFSWFSPHNDVHPKKLLFIVSISVATLLVLSCLIHVDELTRGAGRVIPSKQLQIVQSLDGGVIEEILVKQGDLVKKDQILLKLDPTRAESGVGESLAQSQSLMMRQLRLQAMINDQLFQVPDELKNKYPDLYQTEQQLYQNKRQELIDTVNIVNQQVQQRQQEFQEAQSRRDGLISAIQLTTEELKRTNPLVKEGAVSPVEVLRLQRDLSRLSADQKAAEAQMSRARAAIAEAQQKATTTQINFKNEASKELTDVQTKLNSFAQGQVALNDKVQRATIKSPVDGRIQRLMYNTVGGVVPSGKDMLEIVPSDDVLILETKILPKDIAFIQPNQKAQIKFTAYDYSIYGTVEGIVDSISPDTTVDDKGNAYYLAKVKTLQTTLGKQLVIIPGMTAEVDIKTGSKNLITYLLKPVIKMKSYAFTER